MNPLIARLNQEPLTCELQRAFDDAISTLSKSADVDALVSAYTKAASAKSDDVPTPINSGANQEVAQPASTAANDIVVPRNPSHTEVAVDEELLAQLRRVATPSAIPTDSKNKNATPPTASGVSTWTKSTSYKAFTSGSGGNERSASTRVTVSGVSMPGNSRATLQASGSVNGVRAPFSVARARMETLMKRTKPTLS